jgi:hypothetical protein
MAEKLLKQTNKQTNNKPWVDNNINVFVGLNE